jgi:eight-cysteine-cluster-containing protein
LGLLQLGSYAVAVSLFVSSFFIPLDSFSNECVVSGCSGELCSEAGKEMMSACIYRPEFECYKKYGACEKQSNGVCGWTVNSNLSNCLTVSQSSKSSK